MTDKKLLIPIYSMWNSVGLNTIHQIGLKCNLVAGTTSTGGNL
jgi:hypothetical protein